ncbi:hypothetical protein CM19_06340 [Candidatus Acidianus copahuensis]|uniref:Thioredoxin n=1 Tax=Candidatus Acidianus copahuensis TaxID=1160895 RepID=A0A031LQ20_9CREN|nr:hypothetical protein [Candidatus Acidianus copahuensis]EZQ07111.1 hypothetical protein CM19_06340 [Candidatus Acidianus copahuensis]
MIDERLFQDAKFYDKLIGLFMTADECDECEKVFNELSNLPIFGRFYTKQINLNEYPEYLSRFNTYYVPSFVILSPEANLLGIIQSSDAKFIEDKTREIVEAYLKGYNGEKLKDYIPTPEEPVKQEIIYEVIGDILNGIPADHRAIQLYRFIEKLDEKYKSGEKEIKPLTPEAKFLINGDELQPSPYAQNIAFSVEAGKENGKVLFELIKEGSVFRSKKMENKGLLIDEASVGNALLTEYERTEDQEFLSKALEIHQYIKQNLTHEKGFKDSPPKDRLTQVTFLEPLANAEVSIFLARLYAITGEQNYVEEARKAINCAYAGSRDLKVLARIAISLIKIEDLVKTSNKGPYTDIRLEFVKNLECRYKRGDKCYEKLEDIQFII